MGRTWLLWCLRFALKAAVSVRGTERDGLQQVTPFHTWTWCNPSTSCQISTQTRVRHDETFESGIWNQKFADAQFVEAVYGSSRRNFADNGESFTSPSSVSFHIFLSNNFLFLFRKAAGLERLHDFTSISGWAPFTFQTVCNLSSVLYSLCNHNNVAEVTKCSVTPALLGKSWKQLKKVSWTWIK